MRKSVFTIALLFGLQVNLTAAAQETKIILRVQNSVRPLVEKWAREYSKSNKDIAFQLVSGKAEDENNQISLVTEQTNGAVFFARYAVLPIVSKASDADHLVSSLSLNAKKLRNLFFEKDEFDDEEHKESKAEKLLHVYSGTSQQSASRLYATHFNQENANFKGKRISGDDSFLNTAISRDPLGVTVNSLQNIFDLESRKLKRELSLLPLNIDKKGRLALSEGNLDDIIQLLEHDQFNEIPVGRLGFDYNQRNNLLNDFVHWVLANGTQYVHQYGLLNLSQKELIAELHRTEQFRLRAPRLTARLGAKGIQEAKKDIAQK